VTGESANFSLGLSSRRPDPALATAIARRLPAARACRTDPIVVFRDN